MDREQAAKLLANLERIAKSGQDLAVATMDKEPSQRRQNGLWRYLMQDLRDLKKLFLADDAEK